MHGCGCTKLYLELGLKPDVSIAEEARDSGAVGQDIFDIIMTTPERFAVMDDYTKSVNENDFRRGACLIGDTAVRSCVEEKTALDDRELCVFDTEYFDITEDSSIGLEESFAETSTQMESTILSLLYKPFPHDLPAINKDILILKAAYEGNMERYVRLRRPSLIKKEQFCLERGIYHSTTFAK